MVTVIGAGPTGLSLACALGGAGVPVCVVDRVPLAVIARAGGDTRTTAVAAAGRRMLDALGIWRHLAEAAEPIRDIEVSEGFSRRRIRYDRRVAGREPMGHVVPNALLRLSLLRRAQALPDVTLRVGTAWGGMSPADGAMRLELGNGTTLTTGLVVGADGKRSAVRRAAGIRAIEVPYRQTGIVCTLACERGHEGLAIERFFPNGPFAILPMPENRVAVIWSLDDRLARDVLALDRPAFLAALDDRIGGRLGPLELVGEPQVHRLSLTVATALTADRVALAGDAARAIHPIAGQGWNLGLRDVAALAEVVADAVRAGRDPGSPDILAHYARWRRFDSAALVGVTHGLARLFGNRSATLGLLRDFGLGAVDRIGPLKRMFMFHAMGELGDLPRLMRGMPLRPVAAPLAAAA